MNTCTVLSFSLFQHKRRTPKACEHGLVCYDEKIMIRQDTTGCVPAIFRMIDLQRKFSTLRCLFSYNNYKEPLNSRSEAAISKLVWIIHDQQDADESQEEMAKMTELLNIKENSQNPDAV